MSNQYIPLKANQHYEILNEYPFNIREVETHSAPNTWFNNGTVSVELDNKVYKLHRLIAQQFIPNPNNYRNVLFKSEDIEDVHICNLYWSNKRTPRTLSKRQQQLAYERNKTNNHSIKVTGTPSMNKYKESVKRAQEETNNLRDELKYQLDNGIITREQYNKRLNDFVNETIKELRLINKPLREYFDDKLKQ